MSVFLAPRNYQWQCSWNDLILHQQKGACRRSARHSVHRAGRRRMQQQFVDFGRDAGLEFATASASPRPRRPVRSAWPTRPRSSTSTRRSSAPPSRRLKATSSPDAPEPPATWKRTSPPARSPRTCSRASAATTSHRWSLSSPSGTSSTRVPRWSWPTTRRASTPASSRPSPTAASRCRACLRCWRPPV